MRIRLQCPGLAGSLLAELNRCRQSGRYCDVFLQVGQRTFSAHRAVLACAATYFRNLLGQAPADPISLDFISPATFEKVLSFMYTGEILTDLIDVGVLYELAERLGVSELVRTCHATFPDLRGSAKASSPEAPPAGSSVCSSAASCSSPSSSAALTPAAAPSPHVPAGGPTTDRRSPIETQSTDLKIEDIQSLIDYERVVSGSCLLSSEAPSADPELLTKKEQTVEAAARGAPAVSEKTDDSEPSASCPLPEGLARLGVGTSSSLEGLTSTLEELNQERRALPCNGTIGQPEEEPWDPLAGEIIELSDDDNLIEEGDDNDEGEDDLVCVENGHGSKSSQVQRDMLACRVCAAPLPAEPAALRRHAESHVGEPARCILCSTAFPDSAAGVAHWLAHMGVHIFSCDMCHLEFCNQKKLLRHQRQSGSSDTLAPLSQGCQLRCAVCTQVLSKDFQMVREHILSHVCIQSLCCGVCRIRQRSLCALLWHALTHLSLPVYACPRCARCFVERPLLDAHLAAEHAQEPDDIRVVTVGGDNLSGAQELSGLLCPQTSPASTAFLCNLGQHESFGEADNGPTWFGKRKAEQPSEHPPSSSSSPRDPGAPGKTCGANFGLVPGFPDGYFLGQTQGQDGAGARGKWYRCRYCGKRFAHSGEFTYHLRIHTGEKPYQCKVCLRFFRGRSTIICHLKTHAGALMYRCTVCGLYCSTLKMMAAHVELHKDRLPPDFNMEHTFMYNDHTKEALQSGDI